MEAQPSQQFSLRAPLKIVDVLMELQTRTLYQVAGGNLSLQRAADALVSDQQQVIPIFLGFCRPSPSNDASGGVAKRG